MTRVAFDIGGVLSKFPDILRPIAQALIDGGVDVYVITDMHDHAQVVATLRDNGFGFIPPDRVHCADYATHGEGCKAELLRELAIDMILDDHPGYVAVQGCPIRCLVMPDAERPYWHEDWKASDGASDFGRRVYRKPRIEVSETTTAGGEPVRSK